jgi:hypothetical protein
LFHLLTEFSGWAASRQRLALLCLAAVCAAGAAGCRSALLAEVDAQKPFSLAAWEGRTIDGRPAREYVLARSAVLTSGYEGIVGDVTPTRTAIVQKKGDHGGGCGAVAVTGDGYFLTAGHCVESLPLMLFPLKAGRQVAVPARLITRFESQGTRGCDFAIVHAPIATPDFAALAYKVEPGAPVLCAGSGIGSSSLAAGTVQGEDSCHAGAVLVRVVYHNAPLYLGDSGGPVFDGHGGLVGISVSSEHGLTASPQAEAQLPDPAEIQRLIDADRAARIP